MNKFKLIKTIRFRLTFFYVSFMIFLVFALIAGINVGLRLTPPEPDSPRITDERDKYAHNLFFFSAIGFGCVIVIGSIGGYILSSVMLKPVDKISSLAGRISYTSLKERLNHKGPDDEIKRLADTFDKMLARLEQAAESQKQFIQDVSHELRTPIATALTNIEVLEMNSEATIEDYQNLSSILKLSLDRMNNVNNSLLLLSDDSSNSSLKQSKVYLEGIITEIVNEYSTEARRQNIVLIWDSHTPEAVVSGDPNRIRQVIFNLVDNGIKYNRPEGSVTISLYTQDRSAIIQVKDTGIGIRTEDLPRIFDRFFRVDKSRSRQRGGSGLGLAIVKKIVEEHAGTVSAESIPGQGSSFFITLPLHPTK